MLLEQLHDNRITALYCRLSRDDGYSDDSCSIDSQKAMLERYASDNGLENYEFFVDDGFTGTNFDRPSFSRMIELAEQNKIGTVVVKDLSRLGREYLQTGYYTEIFFPMHDVRFIAINDGVDSANGDNEFAPFKNIINEWYARDISRKIKSSRRIRAERGEYMNGTPPYGYRRDPKHRNHLIPDKNTAPYVKEMFKMASEGKSAYTIAAAMEAAKRPKPSAYILDADGGFHLNPKIEYPYEWHSSTVQGILSNVTYLGHLYAGMTAHRSFKDKRKVKIPREQWIIRENDHKPLVSEKVFLQAKGNAERWHIIHQTVAVDNVFRDICRCADCGYVMWFSVRTDRPSKGYYTCGRFRLAGHRKGCSGHYITLEQLKVLTLGEITRIAAMVVENKEAFIKDLVESAESEFNASMAKIKAELDECNSRIEELNILTLKVYEDRVFKRISDDTYTKFSRRYDKELELLKDKASVLNGSMCQPRFTEEDIRHFADIIEKYADITEITGDIAHELIENIYVHEKKTINGITGMRVEISYRFVGKICGSGNLQAPAIGWRNRTKSLGA